MSLKAIFSSIAQTAASALGSVAPTQTSNPIATANGQATGAQADNALRQMLSKQHQPTVFEEQVKQISPDIVARRNVFDKPVVVELTKPAREMTKPEYDQAFARAVLNKVGLTDASEPEVAKFMNEYARVTGGKFGFIGTEQELRALQAKSNEIQAHTSDYGLAVADAGIRQIYADRQEFAARVEQLRRDSQGYGEEALAGFYKLQANGAINTVNDATKIVGIAEIPKFDVTGEYWSDKKGFAEKVTTMGAAVVTGGASLPSDLLIISSSAGNMMEAVKGTDLRTGAELSTTDRVIRGAGGVVGAVAVRGRVDDITEAVSTGVKNLKPPTNVAEAVTAEGVRMPVKVADDALTTTNIEARSSKQVSGRGVKFEEEALAKARAAHPEGFKPDMETQRLGITNRAAADYVGLEKTKSGGYVAHITEITVKHKSLTELGKQLDGAQKIASSKLGDKIERYEYYIRTSSKELVDAIRQNNNLVPKPGASKRDSFKVTVIFEGGGK